MVPIEYEEDQKLSFWVSTQQYESIIDDKMKQEHCNKLNLIQFVWSVQKWGDSNLEKRWNDKFQRLLRNTQEHGTLSCSKMLHRGSYTRQVGMSPEKVRIAGLNLNQLDLWVAGKSLTAYEKQWENISSSKLEQYTFKNTGTILCLLATKRILHLECGSSNSTLDMKALILNEFLNLNQLGLSGKLAKIWLHVQGTLGGNVCQAREIPPKTWRLSCAISPQRGSLTWSVGLQHVQQMWQTWSNLMPWESLQSIGFVWNLLDHQWEDMFAKLEEYWEEYGDCLIPQDYKEDPPLGRWVNR